MFYCFCRTLHLPTGWNRSKPWNNKQLQEIKLRFNNRCGHHFQTCTWTLPSGALDGFKENRAQHSFTFGGNVCFQTDNSNSNGRHGNGWMFGLAQEERIFSLQFPKPDMGQVDVWRPQLSKTGELSICLYPRLVETFLLLRCTTRSFGTLSLENCFFKSALHKVLKDVADCVPVICLDCCFYVTVAHQCCFRLEVFDSFRLCSTLVLHAVQLHLFSQRTVCRDVGIKKEVRCTWDMMYLCISQKQGSGFEHSWLNLSSHNRELCEMTGRHLQAICSKLRGQLKNHARWTDSWL